MKMFKGLLNNLEKLKDALITEILTLKQLPDHATRK